MSDVVHWLCMHSASSAPNMPTTRCANAALQRKKFVPVMSLSILASSNRMIVWLAC